MFKPLNSTNSSKKITLVTIAPWDVTKSIIAFVVPPVAKTSSIITTFWPGKIKVEATVFCSTFKVLLAVFLLTDHALQELQLV